MIHVAAVHDSHTMLAWRTQTLQLCDMLFALCAAGTSHRTLLAFSSATSKPWVRAIEVAAMQVAKTSLGFALAGLGAAADVGLLGPGGS